MATLEQLPIQAKKTLLHDVNIVDADNSAIIAGTDVAIENGRIVDVGARPAGFEEIPGNGLYVVPGLIDAHSHILSPFLTKQDKFLGAWTARQIGRNLRTNLAAGVVLVRDMLSPIRVMNKVRWLLDRGTLQGPDILASGAILSCKDGYPEFIFPLPWPLVGIIGSPKYHLKTPKHAAHMVRYLKSCGADHIKVGYTSRPRTYVGPLMPVVSREILDAICATAHEIDLKVSVHHNWSDDILPILEADVDSLEHQSNNGIISDEELKRIKETGVTVIPTLTVTHNMSYFDKKTNFMRSPAAAELFEPEAIKHLTFVADTWLDKNETSYQDVFGFWRANPVAYENSKKNAARLYEAEIPILAGTDFGAVVAYSGELTDEIHRLTLIGMSNAEAIAAATSRAAKFMRVENDYGTITPGKKADFFLVEGNPLDDITKLHNVRMIAKNGRWFKPGGDTITPMFNDDYIFQ